MVFSSASFPTLLFQIFLATCGIFVVPSSLLSLYLVWSPCQTFLPLSIPIYLYLPFLCFLFFFLLSFSAQYLLLPLSFFHTKVGISLSLLLLSPSLFLGYMLVAKASPVSPLFFLNYTYPSSFFPHDFCRRHWLLPNVWYSLYCSLFHLHFSLLMAFLTWSS